MKVQKAEGSRERKILIAMIVDRVVLGRIVSRWDEPGLFSSPWANVIGKWCVDYYNQYDKAPGKAIESLFTEWTEQEGDQDTVRLVEKFLTGISDEYVKSKKDHNSEYTIDLAIKYFNHVRMTRILETASGHLDRKQIDKAFATLEKASRINMGEDGWLDLLSDPIVIESSIEAKSEPLIVYPGAVGEFIGDAFERDGFISFEGPEKSGKTWCLLDVAWMGMKQGRNVAFFEIGDLSEHQLIRRFATRAARHPLTLPIRGRKIMYPTFIKRSEGEDVAEVDQEEKVFDKPLTVIKAQKSMKRILERGATKGHGKQLLRLSTHPNNSIGIAGIKSMIEYEVRRGWVPDVIVIDYADLLAPPPGYFKDSRDVVNHNWKALRALSQQFHCLVVTATQTNADSYDVETISKSNFSEDKRKRAHVTGTIGINQNDKEKPFGVMRWNWVVRRESSFSESECVYIAGCLDLASPVVCSTF